MIDTSHNGGIIPVTAKRFGYTLFYVHPETGLLHRIDPTSRNEWRKARGEKQREALHWLNDHFALKQINRIWFACQFKEVPLQGPFKAYDHAREQTVGLGGLVRGRKFTSTASPNVSFPVVNSGVMGCATRQPSRERGLQYVSKHI